MSPDEHDPQNPLLEQARLGNEVAQLVLADVPQPWDRAVLHFRALTTSAEDALFLVTGDQELKDFPPDDTIDLLFALRRVMYVPGAGTWFSMELEITADGRTATRFNYDTEPTWALAPDDARYVEDLKMFPRDLEHQPEWLREKLAHGGAQLSGDIDAMSWTGLRFEASFTADGQLSTSLDFRPSPDAARWVPEAVAGLAVEGVPASAGEDVDDESGAVFPIVRVQVGRGGYCALTFWHDQVFWNLDVAESVGDLDGTRRVCTAVRRVVEAVTGWHFVDSKMAGAYERAVVGLPAVRQ